MTQRRLLRIFPWGGDGGGGSDGGYDHTSEGKRLKGMIGLLVVRGRMQFLLAPSWVMVQGPVLMRISVDFFHLLNDSDWCRRRNEESVLVISSLEVRELKAR